MKTIVKLAAAGVLVLSAPAFAQDTSMSFFITSAGPGDGANLGGLEGADAHCQSLADAAGAGGKTWRAYLSAEGTNAKDRIGSGPWYNAKGDLVAQDVAALHSDPNINKESGLDENGNQVNGRGDSPNRHDILTGSKADGTAAEQTCGNWTLNGEGSAIVGHHDRVGLAMTRRQRVGIPRIQAAAAARRHFRVRAATDCSTASRRNNGRIGGVPGGWTGAPSLLFGDIPSRHIVSLPAFHRHSGPLNCSNSNGRNAARHEIQE